MLLRRSSLAALIAASLTAVAALAGCTPSSQTPAAVPAPTSTPTPVKVSPCYFKDPTATGSDAPLVKVDLHPRAATAVWKPGFNAAICRAVLRTYTRSESETLAADIDYAPPFPRGRFNCPMDDSASVRIYFPYGDPTNAQLAEVNLSGCAQIGGVGRRGRQLTSAVRRDLARLAPGPWRAYLSE
jgi:hypothetical protein